MKNRLAIAAFLMSLALTAFSQPVIKPDQILTIDENSDEGVEVGSVKITHSYINQITSTNQTTHLLKTDGSLWSWGYNFDGVSGIGTNVETLIPTKVGTENNWQSVDQGVGFAVGTKTNGEVFAWGVEYYGEENTNTDYESNTFFTAVRVTEDNDWVSMVGGYTCQFGIKDDGSLWFWGNTGRGESGMGLTYFSSRIPVQLGTDTDWEFIDSEIWVNYALRSDGTLWSWGAFYGDNLGLGLAPGSDDVNVPTQVGSDSDWRIVAIDEYLGYAIKEDGRLFRLGNTVTQVGVDSDWEDVEYYDWSGNGGRAIALKSDGTLWAWGKNDQGQVGDGTTIDRDLPVQIGTDTDWVAIGESFAIKEDGSLWAWGRNDYGELGTETTANLTTPTYIPPIGMQFEITSGNESGAFSITDRGVIKVADASKLDFETSASYELTITATDDNQTSAEESVTINVNNINDGPVIDADQSVSLDENTENGAEVIAVAASDQDGDTLFENWTITSGNDSEAFAIDAETGIITVADQAKLNFEEVSSFLIGITVSDGTTVGFEGFLNITIVDKNEAPVIAAEQAGTVDENSPAGTEVTLITATDEDAGAVLSNWQISSGNENGAFSIDAATGQISVADGNQLDFETTPTMEIGVTVTDGTLTSGEATVVITIQDVNDPPVITADQEGIISENSTNGTEVMQVQAAGGNANTILKSWTISQGNIDGAFAVNPESGLLTVADGTKLNYEARPTYALELTVSDGVNVSEPRLVSISVSNVNEAPTGVSLSTSAIDENLPIGSLVATLATADVDAADTFVYAFVEDSEANDNASFLIASNQLLAKEKFDFETKSNYTVRIKSTDAGGLSTEAQLAIAVNNINDVTLTTALSEPFCDEDSDGEIDLVISDAAPPLSIVWSNGSTEEDLVGLSAGSYDVTVTDSNGHSASATIELGTKAVYQPTIGLVTSDETGIRNKVVWDASESYNVSKFLVYRETSIAGEYEQIGFVESAGATEFVDSESDARTQSYKYKIGVLDNCGTEGSLGEFHKTLHLTSSIGLDNSVNLSWNQYIGVDYSTINLYKGEGSAEKTLLTSLSSSNNSFTDLEVEPDKVYQYVLEIVLNMPISNRAIEQANSSRNNTTYTSIRSNNLVIRGVALGVRDETRSHLYPNPSTGVINVNTNRGGKKNLVIRDLSGNTLRTISSMDQMTELDVSFLKEGLYLMQIDGETSEFIRFFKRDE
ncbi:MAG: cadherin domain-containing protein [Imperialibacter sp.]|uniref:cadherin domain-containing protein n=1 Tax=Imperialibacter sp. TaxID=2038411 RepID=UPI0032F0702E